MTRKILAFCAAAAFAAAADAAPQRETVADGFLEWEGAVERNHLAGRNVEPGDLRHRTVVYVAVDAAKFSGAGTLPLIGLSGFARMPASHATQWETHELPRNRIVVFAVMNAGKEVDEKSFKAAIAAPKNADDPKQYQPWRDNMTPFYKDLKPFGSNIESSDLPYVAVYGCDDVKPVWSKKKWRPRDMEQTKSGVAKADRTMKRWTPPFGVAEPQFYAKEAADVLKGKPAAAAMMRLKAGIKSKNADQAKEAQIMHDALVQMKNDLCLRIALEFSQAPERAFYDYQQICKLFPAEKKNLKDVDKRIKATKEIAVLGRAYEQLSQWSREEFVPKSESEAKKIVGELGKIKKTLAAMESSKNMRIQGKAMLYKSQAEELMETIPAKVQKK